jgi:ubiquinone/menaquinone biosynthesis C-methylase UbiE
MQETCEVQIDTLAPKASKPYRGIGMEGLVAKWYAKTARRDGEFKMWASRVSETVPAGSHVLEVAPGPGYLSVELARLDKYQVTGLDVSRSFVEFARTNARQAGVQVDFRHGNAADMPFADGTFDFIISTAAFKNFAQPVRAIAEMHRVLTPNGKALIVDLRRDACLTSIKEAVNNMGMSRVNALITKWTFRLMLLKTAYTQEQIRQFVSQTSFRQCDIRQDGIGIEIWLRK